MTRTLTDIQLGFVNPEDLCDQALKIGRGFIKPDPLVPDDGQEIKDAYARGERPDLFDATVRAAYQAFMPDQEKRPRGENLGGLILCDEFGHPYGSPLAGTSTIKSENNMDTNFDPNAVVVQHVLKPVAADSQEITEADPKTAEWYAEQDRMYQQTRAEEQARVDAFIAQLRATLPEGIPALRVAMDILKQEMKDADYAWSWHCNIAMPFYDALPEGEPDRHARANRGAGRVMRHVFDVDTMTQYNTDFVRHGYKG